MIIGYARVSTSDQSVERQTRELEAAGAERIYSESASGKRGSVRPEWARCLESLRASDTLMVTELSRLGRSSADLAVLSDELLDRDISLRILNLGIDTKTPAGRLIFTIVGAVASMERELLRERTLSGLANARAKGVKLGGRKPALDKADVRRARQLVRSGSTMQEAAAAVGVARATLYRYLGPVPHPMVDEIEPEPIDTDTLGQLVALVDAGAGA